MALILYQPPRAIPNKHIGILQRADEEPTGLRRCQLEVFGRVLVTSHPNQQRCSCQLGSVADVRIHSVQPAAGDGKLPRQNMCSRSQVRKIR